MKNILTYDEVKELPAKRREAYEARVKESVMVLAAYSPLSAVTDIFEASQCYDVKIKGRTPIGNHFTISIDGAPTKEELKERRATAQAKHDAKFGPDGQDS